jgi:hypothetical protein
MLLKKFSVLAIAAGCMISCSNGGSPATSRPAGAIRKFDHLISFASGPESFPRSWRIAPFHQTASPIDPSQKDRARRLIAISLGKYPAALIKATLREGSIYALGELKVYRRMQFSGTASDKAVYVVVQDKSKGYSDKFIESVFHQEYSTLLMNRYLKHLDMKAWKAINPKGFEYLGPNSWDRIRARDGGAKAIDSKGKTNLLATNKTLLAHGFLVKYSTSSLENDVNGYVAALFANEPSFWANVDKHQTVRKKTDLTIKFYNRLNPVFTEKYFRNIPRIKPARPRRAKKTKN